MTPRFAITLAAVFALAFLAPAIAQDGPGATFPPVKMDAFFVGQAPYQMYVERRAPQTDAGRQPNAIILVHGAGTSGVLWDTTPDGRDGWAPYFLRQGYTVYVVDLPGHGRSPAPPDFTTMGLDKAVADLAALLRLSGPAVVIGHDMGGHIAARLAGAATGDVRANLKGVVLVAPSSVAEIIAAPDAPALDEREPFRLPADVALLLNASSPRFPSEASDQFLLSLQGESPRSYNETLQPGLAPAGGPDIFRDIPTLVIGAEEDLAVRPDRIRAYSSYFNIEMRMTGRDWNLPDHGHMMMIERGNDAIAARLLAWMTR